MAAYRGSEVMLRIIGTDLPGLRCPPSGDFPGYGNIHVAVQRKDDPGELLDLQPGDAERVSWSLPCTAATSTQEGLVLNGPYIQNRLGGRFVYLSWVDLDADGKPRMFRRGKLLLSAVAPPVLAEAVERGQLRARLTMTDEKGHPVSARLVPPHVQWNAENAG
ncbi:DUF5990 family protein [Actinospica sp.]|jgi:hypothetical protein|uniref:DUF5990 family protein n=1 Tax=Actinospica sp. TaxID=1872142 RepID=UPI002C3F4E76|nr:DUF5990 family protein [Actinospica sp.]HWG26268.1 DUF5990 family protein [Actinospica sp.]